MADALMGLLLGVWAGVGMGVGVGPGVEKFFGVAGADCILFWENINRMSRRTDELKTDILNYVKKIDVLYIALGESMDDLDMETYNEVRMTLPRYLQWGFPERRTPVSSARLNPRAAAFVPRARLNPNAMDFVPGAATVAANVVPPPSLPNSINMGETIVPGNIPNPALATLRKTGGRTRRSSRSRSSQRRRN